MNINPIAIYNGNFVIYWSGLIIALGIAAGFLLTLSIYVAQHGSSSAVWVFLPFAIVFSVVLCRVLHWYCHEEQYASFFEAVSDYSYGSYCLPGALLGVYLAALISKNLGFTSNTGKLLDAIAPGFALTIALVRLSSLFNTSCRSKYTVEADIFKRLPFAVAVSDASGNVSYRFATFFVEFLIMLVVTVVLIGMYYRFHNARMKRPCRRDGHIFGLFLIYFGAVELVLDSTRNDSSFMHFPGTLKIINKFFGFVSVGQLCSAIIILFIMLYYSKRSIRANGHKAYHVVLWSTYFVSLAIVGVLEYCVQRWSNMHNIIYIGMVIGALIMTISAQKMYKSCIESVEPLQDEYE